MLVFPVLPYVQIVLTATRIRVLTICKRDEGRADVARQCLIVSVVRQDIGAEREGDLDRFNFSYVEVRAADLTSYIRSRRDTSRFSPVGREVVESVSV